MKDIKKVIQGCLKNDRRSQFKLYNYCFDGMMSICMRYEQDRDMALEVLNSAFLKVLKKLDTYKKEYPFEPWFKRITVNEAIDEYRRKKRRQELIDNEIDYLENLSAGSTSGSMDWVEDEYLQSLLDSLKEEHRVVFNLYAIDGLAHKEIADLLDISERTSIRHLSTARRTLQELIVANELGLRKA